jgi:SAM-dependent methyltransferase
MAAEATSVAFDRAAGYYDDTRSFPAEVAAAQTELLARELAAADRVVEVGVGTGRIAIPLAVAGVRVFGADLSAPMLQRLVSKALGAVPVAVADATRLPFHDEAFGGAVVVHLLHLVPAWERILDELGRVLRPGATLLVNLGSSGGLGWEIRDRVIAAAGHGGGYPGLDPSADLNQVLTDRGFDPRPLPEIPNPRTRTAGEWLDEIATNRYSWTWPIEPAALQRAVAETREWVRATHGTPETVVIQAHPIRWRAYDLPR